jgi:NAD(P)-dependent dehydrogenase (short-subunit alcohol dehydrogenase family)
VDGRVRLAVVTGASAGIGAATAAAFLADGWRVTSVSRRPCPVPRADSLACDLADPAAVDEAAAALAEAAAAAERVVLVHNASLLRHDAADGTDPEDFARVLQVNLGAPNALNRAILPRLGAGSAVVYVGSTLSEKAVPGAHSYVVTKHAAVGMMRATCQDLAGRGVHTACVCPGFTDTEMLGEHLGTDAETRAAAAYLSAFGRLIEPAEIAETIVWAATHPVVNGAVIHANLGQLER